MRALFPTYFETLAFLSSADDLPSVETKRNTTPSKIAILKTALGATGRHRSLGSLRKSPIPCGGKNANLFNGISFDRQRGGFWFRLGDPCRGCGNKEGRRRKRRRWRTTADDDGERQGRVWRCRRHQRGQRRRRRRRRRHRGQRQTTTDEGGDNEGEDFREDEGGGDEDDDNERTRRRTRTADDDDFGVPWIGGRADARPEALRLGAVDARIIARHMRRLPAASLKRRLAALLGPEGPALKGVRLPAAESARRGARPPQPRMRLVGSRRIFALRSAPSRQRGAAEGDAPLALPASSAAASEGCARARPSWRPLDREPRSQRCASGQASARLACQHLATALAASAASAVLHSIILRSIAGASLGLAPLLAHQADPPWPSPPTLSGRSIARRRMPSLVRQSHPSGSAAFHVNAAQAVDKPSRSATHR